MFRVDEVGKKALVVFSGGQDSTTTLFTAIHKYGFKNILAITFKYGQRHKVEINSARKIIRIAAKYCDKICFRLISTGVMKEIGDSALLCDDESVSAEHKLDKSLPASFVPGRNLFFLTVAAMIAYHERIKDIFVGVSQADFSGYPDCRDLTIKAMNVALSLGMDYQFTIHTPLMWLTKREEVELALELPGCMEALAYSHTCYEGKYPPCGKCPACKLRAKGFEEAGVEDPLITRAREEGLL